MKTAFSLPPPQGEGVVERPTQTETLHIFVAPSLPPPQGEGVVERPTQTETLHMFVAPSLPPPQGEGREGVHDKETART